ncbi:hypothetical protein POM88_017322 [Heracleum sosnowskyi]|uniref:HAT C-terminal dimerisation domain-containing protein n=1 Tax=Heracleum sosnowskyi TaxID=360622 RepID=A0AAD8IQ98_9APIA|nr:hypothetical protein POM88_017322 [Heracleum sosnowskyi]
MASDVLSIPISTVASESTFSAGSRVIEPHRSCLKPETVEVLLCGADWVRELYGLKKSKQNEDKDIKIEKEKLEKLARKVARVAEFLEAEFDDIIPASAATIAAGAFTAATINIHFIWCIVGDQDFFSLPIRA